MPTEMERQARSSAVRYRIASEYALRSTTEAVYPRRGQPIVPPMLADFLGESGPFSIASGSPLQAKDLDATVWNRCSPITCRKLGTMVVERLRSLMNRFPAKHAAHPLPDPPTLMRSVLLENRTYGLLARRLPTLAVDGPWTVGRYLTIPGFGARATLDVLTSLWGSTVSREMHRPLPGRGTLDDVVARVEELHRTYRIGTFRIAPSSITDPRMDDATYIDEVIAVLVREMPLSEDEVRKRLRKERMVMETIDLPRLLKAATWMGQEPPFSIVKLAGARIAVRRHQAATVTNAYAVAVRIIHNRGLATVADVAAQLSSAMASSVDVGLVSKILASFRGFEWLHEETGWFWLRDRSSPVTDALTKIFSVTTRLSLERLHRVLFKAQSLEVRAPSVVVANLGLALPGMRVQGNELVVARMFDRSVHLSADERTLVEALATIGGAVSIQDLRGSGALRSISRRVLIRLVRTSPLVEVLTNGRVCLVGAGGVSAASFA